MLLLLEGPVGFPQVASLKAEILSFTSSDVIFLVHMWA